MMMREMIAFAVSLLLFAVPCFIVGMILLAVWNEHGGVIRLIIGVGMLITSIPMLLKAVFVLLMSVFVDR